MKNYWFISYAVEFSTDAGVVRALRNKVITSHPFVWERRAFDDYHDGVTLIHFCKMNADDLEAYGIKDYWS